MLVCRKERLRAETAEAGETSPGCWGRWSQFSGQFNIPLRSPAVHQPLALILTSLALQHLSGFTFNKKFLLQVIDAKDKTSTESDSRVPGKEQFKHLFIGARKPLPNFAFSDVDLFVLIKLQGSDLWKQKLLRMLLHILIY